MEQASQGQQSGVVMLTLFYQPQIDVFQVNSSKPRHLLREPYGHQGQLVHPSLLGSKSIDRSLRYFYLPRTKGGQAIGTFQGIMR